MAGNLPDDVTPGDIDRHYGEPDTVTVHGSVSVAVSVDVPADADAREQKKMLRAAVEDGFDQVLSAEIGEVERR